MNTASKLIIISFIFGGLGLISNGIYQVGKDKVEDSIVTEVKQNGYDVKIGKFEFSKKGEPQTISKIVKVKTKENQYLRYVGAIFGAISLIFAIIACCLSKEYRIGSIAGSLGLICLAWEYVLIAVGIGEFVIIISLLSI
jgi:hypothetical protein